MADFTDVANTLVGLIAGIVYPNGTASPSITGAPIKIYQGWPDAVQIQPDLKNGVVNISVFPKNEKPLPMRNLEWQQLSIVPATTTFVAAGTTITFGGTISAGQNIAVLVDSKPYVYPVQASDTLNGIAAALATLISADRPASSTGPVLSVPNTHTLIARVGTTGTSIRELSRQDQFFQITIWANCFDQRDPLAKVLVPALTSSYRIQLSDGMQGILRYRNSIQHDEMQKQGLYRRDLMYSVEYAVTETLTDTQVVTQQTDIGVAPLPGGAEVGHITINS